MGNVLCCVKMNKTSNRSKIATQEFVPSGSLPRSNKIKVKKEYSEQSSLEDCSKAQKIQIHKVPISKPFEIESSTHRFKNPSIVTKHNPAVVNTGTQTDIQPLLSLVMETIAKMGFTQQQNTSAPQVVRPPLQRGNAFQPQLTVTSISNQLPTNTRNSIGMPASPIICSTLKNLDKPVQKYLSKSFRLPKNQSKNSFLKRAVQINNQVNPFATISSSVSSSFSNRTLEEEDKVEPERPHFSSRNKTSGSKEGRSISQGLLRLWRSKQEKKKLDRQSTPQLGGKLTNPFPLKKKNSASKKQKLEAFKQGMAAQIKGRFNKFNVSTPYKKRSIVNRSSLKKINRQNSARIESSINQSSNQTIKINNFSRRVTYSKNLVMESNQEVRELSTPAPLQGSMSGMRRSSTSKKLPLKPILRLNTFEKAQQNLLKLNLRRGSKASSPVNSNSPFSPYQQAPGSVTKKLMVFQRTSCGVANKKKLFSFRSNHSQTAQKNALARSSLLRKQIILQKSDNKAQNGHYKQVLNKSAMSAYNQYQEVQKVQQANRNKERVLASPSKTIVSQQQRKKLFIPIDYSSDSASLSEEFSQEEQPFVVSIRSLPHKSSQEVNDSDLMIIPNDNQSQGLKDFRQIKKMKSSKFKHMKVINSINMSLSSEGSISKGHKKPSTRRVRKLQSRISYGFTPLNRTSKVKKSSQIISIDEEQSQNGKPSEKMGFGEMAKVQRPSKIQGFTQRRKILNMSDLDLTNKSYACTIYSNKDVIRRQTTVNTLNSPMPDTQVDQKIVTLIPRK